MQLNKKDIINKLKKGLHFPPIEFQLANPEIKSSEQEVILQAKIERENLIFKAEIITLCTPLKFKEAVRRIQDKPKSEEHLLITTYLGPERLEELRQLKLCGIDMCGNGIIYLSNKRIYIDKTGKPNLYPESRKTKYTYQGTTSLVARTFLLKKSFTQVNEIKNFIENKGVEISLSTISKALSRLEQDIIIDRKNSKINLIQKDKLIENLTANFTSPLPTRNITCTLENSLNNLFINNSSQHNIVLSGKSSISQYAIMGRDEINTIYVEDCEEFVASNKKHLQESTKFINLNIQEIKEPTPFYDIRRINNIPYSSPIQSYLECAIGDKRERDTSEEIKELIFKEQI
jgi:hypothetical protein